MRHKCIGGAALSKAAWRLLAEPDVKLGGHEWPGLGRLLPEARWDFPVILGRHFQRQVLPRAGTRCSHTIPDHRSAGTLIQHPSVPYAPGGDLSIRPTVREASALSGTQRINAGLQTVASMVFHNVTLEIDHRNPKPQTGVTV